MQKGDPCKKHNVQDLKIEFLINVKRKFARVLPNLVVESEHIITICFEFQDFEFLALEGLRL